MAPSIELTGQKFGRLLVVEKTTVRKFGRTVWLCQCDCGNATLVEGQNLTQGTTTSCGCYHLELLTKHGKWGTQEWRLFTSAKHRAKKHGIEFTITLDDVIVPEICPILGIPIIRHSKGRTEGSPSLDRKNPTKGYRPENVWVVSWRANEIKSDLTRDEAVRLAMNWPEDPA